MKQRCLVIPAIKKNAVIPDQLVKKLAGKTLIARALETALAVAAPSDILVVTDSDEIRLICERSSVGCAYDPQYMIRSVNIVSAMRPILERLAGEYADIIIYRASAPLVTAADIEDAYRCFVAGKSDCLVTVKNVKYRLWQEKGDSIDALFFNEEEQTAYVESRSLFMLRGTALAPRAGADGAGLRTIPYFLDERGIEINSYLDWWVCEKILQSRHIVFVVAGYPAIGMGHIFRALMLAHEITDHRITFLCTRESELAAANIAARDYRTSMQQSDDLAADVLQLRPDLVINDILDTSGGYMAKLKNAGVPVVNFEDQGEGAALADLVINALYKSDENDNPRHLCGHRHFCLRDEFVQAERNLFRAVPERLLITFGGTDSSDYTRKTLDAVLPLCMENNIRISVVAGPGYAHKESLAKHLSGIDPEGSHVNFTYATNIMSREMENTDMAICSAGRTVFELAHMRIPAIVLSHNERECLHTFARSRNGFIYLGLMREFDAKKLHKAFLRLLDAQYRRLLHNRLDRFDFSGNKSRVVDRMLALLDGTTAGRVNEAFL